MLLIDTSVWIAHFRGGRTGLERFLQEGLVLSHPFIIGELACGRLNRRKEILALLEALPRAVLASHDEALFFLDQYDLAGTGLGFIDIHLLASARLTPAPLWTLDTKLRAAARRLDVSLEPE